MSFFGKINKKIVLHRGDRKITAQDSLVKKEKEIFFPFPMLMNN